MEGAWELKGKPFFRCVFCASLLANGRKKAPLVWRGFRLGQHALENPTAYSLTLASAADGYPLIHKLGIAR